MCSICGCFVIWWMDSGDKSFILKNNYRELLHITWVMNIRWVLLVIFMFFMLFESFKTSQIKWKKLRLVFNSRKTSQTSFSVIPPLDVQQNKLPAGKTRSCHCLTDNYKLDIEVFFFFFLQAPHLSSSIMINSRNRLLYTYSHAGNAACETFCCSLFSVDFRSIN